MEASPTTPIPSNLFGGLTSDGFGYLSRRSRSTKPIIAAVNGIAFGGGLEIVLNCDLVLASERAKFGFVETKNGLIAIQGGEGLTIFMKKLSIGLNSVRKLYLGLPG